MKYFAYIVGQGDTLQEIAQSQLGIDDVALIVALNNLRYPYISDDPQDQYAHAKGALQLSNALNSGISQYTFSNINSLSVANLDTIYFEEWTSGLYESVVVKNATLNSDGSVSVTFQTATVNNYSPAAMVTLFSNQENVITKVLKTGDQLQLPVTSGALISNAIQSSDLYGTDVKLDDTGIVQRTATGWAIVSGIDNVSQATKMRWRTPYGAHPFHDDYGNRMFDLIGENGEPYYWNLAKTFARLCALSDPRVQDISDPALTSDSNGTYIVAEITPSNSNDSFTVSAITGGV